MESKDKEFGEFARQLNNSRKALSVPVLIDWEEQLKIVVRDLIAKRNSSSNKIVQSFDDVLKYYLGEEDFQKYVIKGKKIK